MSITVEVDNPDIIVEVPVQDIIVETPVHEIIVEVAGGVGGTGGGVTDHGALTGLSDPDHPIAAVQGLQAALDGKAPTVHSHALADLPSTIATDSEVIAAVNAHAAAADPHPTYLTVSEGNALYAPIGGGGGSGIAPDTIDAKGDLLVGTADNTVDNLPVGPNNYVLTADSASATFGMKWAPGGSGATLPYVVVAAATGVAATDTANIRAAIASVQPGYNPNGGLSGTISTGEVGVSGGIVVFPPGEYVINDTIYLRQFAGTLSGGGAYSTSPNHPTNPGKATVIRWGGAAGIPMFKLKDYEGITIEDIRFEGNDTNPPSHGIYSEYKSATDGQAGGERLLLQRCHFGKYRRPSDGSGVTKGLITTGVEFNGDNGDNDQWHMRQCTFLGMTGYGVRIGQTQSIWGFMEDCDFSQISGTAALCTASSTTIMNFTCDLNEVDLKTEQDAKVVVFGWWSERCKHYYWDLDSGATLAVYGGKLQMNDTAGIGGANTLEGAAYFNAPNTLSGDLTLQGISFYSTLTNTPAMYLMGADSNENGMEGTGKPYRYTVTIKNCHGLTRSQLQNAASNLAAGNHPGRFFVDISIDGLDIQTTLTERPLSTHFAPQVVTSAYTLKYGEKAPLVVAGTSGGVTLPNLEAKWVAPLNIPHTIINTRATSVTISAYAGQTINGAASISLAAGQWTMLWNVGSVWYAGVPGTGGGGDTVSPIVDAKGDLLVASGADALARLAVGSNNQVLTADSSATNGVKWATPAAGGGLDQATADGLYVNITGDTLTGELLSPTPTSAQALTNKAYVDARTPKITVGTTAPSNPAINDIWVDTN